MATVQKFLYFDTSIVANLIQWGSGISDAIGATMGWTQQPDTGQVIWTATVLTLTQVTVGANAVYSYSSYTGPAPRVGMSIIVTGFATGGNNVTGTLTAVSGGASGTVTMALTTQANETHAGSGTTTAQAAVPASAYVYEIWAPADALQTGATAYYFKIEYGFSTTVLRIRLSIGTGTNGAGTLTGFVVGTFVLPFSDGAIQGANGFECNFSGDTGRMGVMLWRNNPMAGGKWAWFIERTLATDGTPNADGVTLVEISAASSGNGNYNQQTLVFGVGAAPLITNGVITLVGSGSALGAFNNNQAMSPVFPLYGKFGNPMTVCGTAWGADVAEGGLIQMTLYGATHIYMASKTPVNFSQLANNYNISTTSFALLMRYD